MKNHEILLWGALDQFPLAFLTQIIENQPDTALG